IAAPRFANLPGNLSQALRWRIRKRHAFSQSVELVARAHADGKFAVRSVARHTQSKGASDRRLVIWAYHAFHVEGFARLEYGLVHIDMIEFCHFFSISELDLQTDVLERCALETVIDYFRSGTEQIRAYRIKSEVKPVAAVDCAVRGEIRGETIRSLDWVHSCGFHCACHFHHIRCRALMRSVDGRDCSSGKQLRREVGMVDDRAMESALYMPCVIFYGISGGDHSCCAPQLPADAPRSVRGD